jgi:hypothetical protein
MEKRVIPVRRVLVSVALAATIALLPLTTAVAQAQAGVGKSTGLAVPITGSAMRVADGTVQAVSGVFTIQRFVAQRGQGIVATGTYVATVTDVTGAVQTIVTQLSIPLVMPNPSGASVAAVASCDVLNLVLGPLHLDLLGLVVDLNQVVLNITAVPGAGNLLGNLLCAITGLLDGGIGGALGQIAALLNTLLGLLT